MPEDWTVDESATDLLLSGHLLTIHPKGNTLKSNIRMTFRRAGEDVLLWPTGAGDGEFTQQGSLDIAGRPARRVLLVCPNGQITSIWYQGETDANIQRGDLEFGFIFSSSKTHCQEGHTLEGKTQQVGEMIIASLAVP